MRSSLCVAVLLGLSMNSVSMAAVSYSGGNRYIQTVYGVYSGGNEQDNQQQYVSGYPTMWSDTVSVQSTIKPAVQASASMTLAFGSDGFSGSGVASAESTVSPGDTSNGTCSAAFYFTLDQACDYVLNGSVQTDNDGSVWVKIHDANYALVVNQTLVMPGTTNFDGTTGTLEAGTYFFEGYTEAVSMDWGNNSTSFAYDMTFTPVVPEPATAALLGVGLVGLIRRRRA